jgi:hypothetical protein
MRLAEEQSKWLASQARVSKVSFCFECDPKAERKMAKYRNRGAEMPSGIDGLCRGTETVRGLSILEAG